MMQQMRNPKNVKLISLFIAAIFVIGCFTLSLSQSGFNRTAQAASSESAIGVVNMQMLISQSAAWRQAGQTWQAEAAAAQKDFDEKSKDMNDSEKQKYFEQTKERLANRQKELTEPVYKSIEAAIKKVADKKGLSVVVEKVTVIYGGVDITEEVAKELQGGKK